MISFRLCSLPPVKLSYDRDISCSYSLVRCVTREKEIRRTSMSQSGFDDVGKAMSRYARGKFRSGSM